MRKDFQGIHSFEDNDILEASSPRSNSFKGHALMNLSNLEESKGGPDNRVTQSQFAMVCQPLTATLDTSLKPKCPAKFKKMKDIRNDRRVSHLNPISKPFLDDETLKKLTVRNSHIKSDTSSSSDKSEG